MSLQRGWWKRQFHQINGANQRPWTKGSMLRWLQRFAIGLLYFHGQWDSWIGPEDSGSDKWGHSCSSSRKNSHSLYHYFSTGYTRIRPGCTWRASSSQRVGSIELRIRLYHLHHLVKHRAKSSQYRPCSTWRARTKSKKSCRNTSSNSLLAKIRRIWWVL